MISMNKDYITWKLMAGYLLIVLLMLLSSSAKAQSPCGNDGLCVVQFNAGFNESNKVDWLSELTDCKNFYIAIDESKEASGKYKIVGIPTILIFNGEEEVGRFQANIMMQMEATKEDVQTQIDEITMEGF